jgi:uncharacterized protein (DUF1697 family)
VPTWVALLRAVNLGARNKVPMAPLRAALEAAGFADVRTYVNSGNVVLGSPARSAAEVGRAVHDLIAAEFGVDTPVIMRTGPQLAAVRDWNPFPDAALDRPQLLAVLHLASAPAAEAVSTLLANDFSPVRIAHRGEEIVVDWHSRTGQPRADRALRKVGVEATARNWRTLTALTELAR